MVCHVFVWMCYRLQATDYVDRYIRATTTSSFPPFRHQVSSIPKINLIHRGVPFQILRPFKFQNVFGFFQRHYFRTGDALLFSMLRGRRSVHVVQLWHVFHFAPTSRQLLRPHERVDTNVPVHELCFDGLWTENREQRTARTENSENRKQRKVEKY